MFEDWEERDPARIPEIMTVLEVLWMSNPSLRLGQLILNVIDKDMLYNIEDEDLIEALEAKYGISQVPL